MDVVIGDGDGDGATVVVVVDVVVLSGVGDGAGVVDVVVVVLLSGTGAGFTVVVVVVVEEVVDVLVVFLSSGIGLGVVVVELSGAAVVVFLSSITATVVEIMSEGAAAADWSVPHATVAIMRQDTPTTNANLEGVIIPPYCVLPRSDNFLLSPLFALHVVLLLLFLLLVWPCVYKCVFFFLVGYRSRAEFAGNRSIDCSRPGRSFLLFYVVLCWLKPNLSWH